MSPSLNAMAETTMAAHPAPDPAPHILVVVVETVQGLLVLPIHPALLAVRTVVNRNYKITVITTSPQTRLLNDSIN